MSDEEYSDDDDSSWKVRRAAAKCMVAILGNYLDALNSLYPIASRALLARFREREENVKADVLNAFVVLLHQVQPRPPLP
jgi:cullin-associated NEDD8-dissociated protein 1